MAEGWHIKLARRAQWWKNAKTGRERIDVALIVTDNARVMLQDAVDQARAEGASWQEVGDALGISRQAAWERFGLFVDGDGS
jgi:hypothetical protein